MGGQNHAPKKTVTLVKSTLVTDKPIDNIAKVLPVKSKPLPRVKPIIKKDDKTEISNKVGNIRHSTDLEKSEDNSLYVSALEDVTESLKKIRRSNNKVISILRGVLYAIFQSYDIYPQQKLRDQNSLTIFFFF